MLKIILNLTACHFFRANDAVTKFWKVVYDYKSFQNELNELYSLCSSKAFKGMVY